MIIDTSLMAVIWLITYILTCKNIFYKTIAIIYRNVSPIFLIFVMYIYIEIPTIYCCTCNFIRKIKNIYSYLLLYLPFNFTLPFLFMCRIIFYLSSGFNLLAQYNFASSLFLVIFWQIYYIFTYLRLINIMVYILFTQSFLKSVEWIQ